MFVKPYQNALIGDLAALSACLIIMARRARLLGLDAPGDGGGGQTLDRKILNMRAFCVPRGIRCCDPCRSLPRRCCRLSCRPVDVAHVSRRSARPVIPKNQKEQTVAQRWLWRWSGYAGLTVAAGPAGQLRSARPASLRSSVCLPFSPSRTTSCVIIEKKARTKGWSTVTGIGFSRRWSPFLYSMMS
jgi:hypothetical protein